MVGMNTPAQTEASDAQKSDADDPALKAAQAAIDAYRTEHQDAHLERLRTPVNTEGDFVVAVARLPTTAEWLMVKAKQMDVDANNRASANRLIVNTCVIYPKGPELTATLKRYPAIVDVWAGEIAEMAGAIKGTVREKV